MKDDEKIIHHKLKLKSSSLLIWHFCILYIYSYFVSFQWTNWYTFHVVWCLKRVHASEYCIRLLLINCNRLAISGCYQVLLIGIKLLRTKLGNISSPSCNPPSHLVLFFVYFCVWKKLRKLCKRFILLFRFVMCKKPKTKNAMKKKITINLHEATEFILFNERIGAHIWKQKAFFIHYWNI